MLKQSGIHLDCLNFSSFGERFTKLRLGSNQDDWRFVLFDLTDKAQEIAEEINYIQSFCKYQLVKFADLYERN